MSAEEDWKAAAVVWERRTTALRGIVDLLLDVANHAVDKLRDKEAQLEHTARMIRVVRALDEMTRRADLSGPPNRDAFESAVRAEKSSLFEGLRRAINEELRRKGLGENAFDDVLGELPRLPEAPGPSMPAWDAERAERLADFFLDVYRETTDEDPRDLLLRAMGVYRSFVKHARAGGQVKFVREGAPERTLKVRLR